MSGWNESVEGTCGKKADSGASPSPGNPTLLRKACWPVPAPSLSLHLLTPYLSRAAQRRRWPCQDHKAAPWQASGAPESEEAGP